MADDLDGLWLSNLVLSPCLSGARFACGCTKRRSHFTWKFRANLGYRIEINRVAAGDRANQPNGREQRWRLGVAQFRRATPTGSRYVFDQ